MNSNLPIGVFDSGLGGLTVLKALRQLLPHENIIFFGDAARAPYGSRSSSEIEKYLHQFAEYFKYRRVKMAICACNTMTSYGVEFMRQWNDYIMIPMNPAIIPAVQCSPNKKIGVIATEATINKNMHKNAAAMLDPGIQVVGVPCPEFVPLIESGNITGNEIEHAVEIYVKKFYKSNIHSLILGCTHYPIIEPILQKYLAKDIVLINPAMETAKQAQEVLLAKGLQHTKPEKGTTELIFSAVGSKTKDMAEMILGEEINNIKITDLDNVSTWGN